MPGRDQTGPTGEGAKTGRALGGCEGDLKPEDTRQIRGSGFGYGSGRGRGFGGGMGRGRRLRRGGFDVQANPEDEGHFLRNRRDRLQSRLNDIDKRLDELAAQESEEG